MSFWILSALIAVLALAPLALAMTKGRGLNDQDSSAADLEIDLYKQQLGEVDRDLSRGVLSKEDAKRSKLEISRRLLEADKSRSSSGKKNKASPVALALVLVGAALAATLALYDQLGAPGYPDQPLSDRMARAALAYEHRPSQADLETSAPELEIEIDPEHVNLVEQLRAAMAMRPDDVQGLELLVRNEANIGNLRQAYETQRQLIAVKGDQASLFDYEILADLMVQSAGGMISPEAENVVQDILNADPQNGTALFYSGLMFMQTGRPDLTFQFWQPLLARSNPNDPWVRPIRSQIENMAALAGIRYSLPPLNAPTSAGPSDLSGPTEDDIAAAAEMSQEERSAMIRSMVDGLSARLANEGGAPEEWARLITALSVLGETDRAAAIWDEAQRTFGAEPDMLEIVRSGARGAGLLGDAQ